MFNFSDYDGESLSALAPPLGISLSFDEAEGGLSVGRDSPHRSVAAWKLNRKIWF